MVKKYLGSCHCKNVLFSFYSAEKVKVIECNCSICKPLSYLHLIIPHRSFSLIKGETFLKRYTFGTKSAIHFFCRRCGIKSFYQPRSHKDCYSINYFSIIKPPIIEKKIQFDGKNYEDSLYSIALK